MPSWVRVRGSGRGRGRGRHLDALFSPPGASAAQARVRSRVGVRGRDRVRGRHLDAREDVSVALA